MIKLHAKGLRFESLREGFPSRWESVGFCPIDASIRGCQRLPSGFKKFKMSEIPRTGGSILSVMEEIVKVGITMGYNMDGDSIGNSGGILCIWDPNSFRKDSVTVSDYFVIVRDYLSHVSNQWAGEVVMMGDFNEVRYKSDRFGSNFNAHGADIFNNFIINAGLEEVPLGGSAYTWCHKSASKMSKLDRFLMLGVYDSNAMRNLCGKLKFLKVKIRAWYADYRNNSKGSVTNFKEELRILDEIDCIKEFFQHFRNRFDKPPDQNAHIDMPFPNLLRTDQQKVFECMVSKKSVSGLDKIVQKQIMGIHVDADRIKSAASKLGCLVLNTPFPLFRLVPSCFVIFDL
ncbi:RNA-directed DNA polymerase, eukaryota [Tanacetum coccineum]